MGAPGYTNFCKNGHIVKTVLHHYIDFLEVRKCQYCGSTEFVSLCEWGDDDYGPHSVPYEPLKFEWVEVNNDHFKGQQKVFVYDVSKIQRWYKPTQDEQKNCTDCGNSFVLEGGEIDFYNNKGLQHPKRCKSCRQKKKVATTPQPKWVPVDDENFKGQQKVLV